MQRSSPQLRNRVHEELTALLGPGGSLHEPPPRLAALLSDDTLLVDVARKYRRSTPSGAFDGHAVVITAGPPGAGKSSAVASLGAAHRRIDSDDIKDLLLARAESEGLLADRANHRLSDDRIVRPAELAGWTHHASTDIANLVRAESLRLGENIVIEGTLAWNGLIRQYPDELARYDYEKLTVLSAPVRSADLFAERDRNLHWSGPLFCNWFG